MTKSLLTKILPLAACALSLSACAPRIYVIDNQTVLEEQAAGNWPQFEKEVIEKSKHKGPAPLSQVPVNARKARLFNVLNGPMGLSSAEASSKNEAPANQAN